MNTIAIEVPPTSLLCAEELARASQFLIFTRDSLTEAISGLSNAQWHFKPAPETWSVAENVEHLAILEWRVQFVVAALPGASPAEPNRNNSEVEQIILTRTPDRDTKLQAPPVARPSGEWAPAESLARFLKSRAHTLELLISAPCLRGRVLPHPFFGPWDGYQWILAVAGHTARHVGQIMEVKSCPGFPSAETAPVN